MSTKEGTVRVSKVSKATKVYWGNLAHQVKSTVDKKRKSAKRGEKLAKLFGDLKTKELNPSSGQPCVTLNIRSTNQQNKMLLLANFLLEEYGGPRFLIELADTTLDFVGELFPENKRYQFMVDALKYTLPGTIATYDLYKRVNKFLQRQDKNTVHDDHLFKILTILGLPLESYERIANYSVDKIGREVITWAMNKPKTEGFKILKYLGANLEDIDPKSLSDKPTDLYIPIEFNNTKVVWFLEVKLSDFGIVVYQSSVYGVTEQTISKKKTLEFRTAVIKEFIKSFDIKNNVLMYRTGLVPRERITIEDKINQFDVPGLAKEIRKVISIGKKRGYGLVGFPGTGKTSVVLKLEDELREYPFLYLSPSEFEYKDDIKEVFSIIRSIQPCIVILEDLDSYDFKQKTDRLGVFLNEIDAVRGDLNAVFIATINDTSNVHYSLINRPGRFDQVVMINPPTQEDEVYQIMVTKFDKEIKRYHKDAELKSLVSWEEVRKDTLKKVLQNRLTQVDVCDVIERCLLTSTVIDNDLMSKSLIALLETKRAIKECNFRDQDPNGSITLEIDSDKCEAAQLTSITSPDESVEEELELKAVFANRTDNPTQLSEGKL